MSHIPRGARQVRVPQYDLLGLWTPQIQIYVASDQEVQAHDQQALARLVEVICVNDLSALQGLLDLLYLPGRCKVRKRHLKLFIVLVMILKLVLVQPISVKSGVVCTYDEEVLHIIQEDSGLILVAPIA